MRRPGYPWRDVQRLGNAWPHKVLVWLGLRRSPSPALLVAMRDAVPAMCHAFDEAAYRAQHPNAVTVRLPLGEDGRLDLTPPDGTSPVLRDRRY